MNGLFDAFSMDGHPKARDAGIKGSQGGEGVLRGDFPEDDVIGRNSHQMVIELPPVHHARSGTRLPGRDQADAIPELRNLQLRRILDRHHAPSRVQLIEQHVQERGLAGVGSPGNHKVCFRTRGIDQVVSDLVGHAQMRPIRNEGMLAPDGQA